MPLRAILQHRPATIQEFQFAAEERYWDGLEFMVAGRAGGGLYLLGYVAEMLLKCASFRLTPRHKTDGSRATTIGPCEGAWAAPDAIDPRRELLSAWADLDQQDRSEIILFAYEQIAAPAEVTQVTVAMGLTHPEAHNMGIKLD
jgi:hypothetical protein